MGGVESHVISVGSWVPYNGGSRTIGKLCHKGSAVMLGVVSSGGCRIVEGAIRKRFRDILRGSGERFWRDAFAEAV